MIGIAATSDTKNTGHESVPVSPDVGAKLNASIQVWIVPFSVLQTQVCQLHRLSSDERLRASTMLLPRGERNYSLARSFLRSVLASQMSCFPCDINIQYLANGKPFVSDGPAFNLSHCKQLLVVAIANNEFIGQIGVDVEARVKGPDGLRLAERCFTQSERNQLETFQPGTSKQSAFTRGWTRKEAVVKAIGMGLQAPLNSFDVSLEPGGACELNELSVRRQSLLLASQSKSVSLKFCKLYDLGPRLCCEVSLAVIQQCAAGASVVQVHDVDQCQLNALAEFDHG